MMHQFMYFDDLIIMCTVIISSPRQRPTRSVQCETAWDFLHIKTQRTFLWMSSPIMCMQKPGRWADFSRASYSAGASHSCGRWERERNNSASSVFCVFYELEFVLCA